MTLILSDDSAGRHQTPAGHPERPERYQAVTAAVAGSGLRVENAPLASRDQLALVHSERYLDMIFDTLEEPDFSGNRLVQLDADRWKRFHKVGQFRPYSHNLTSACGEVLLVLVLQRLVRRLAFLPFHKILPRFKGPEVSLYQGSSLVALIAFATIW